MEEGPLDLPYSRKFQSKKWIGGTPILQKLQGVDLFQDFGVDRIEPNKTPEILKKRSLSKIGH